MSTRSETNRADERAVSGPARGRVLLGTILLSTANVSKLALQLVLIPILARLLGPSVFGLMSVAMSFVLLANMLSDGGMGPALVIEQNAEPDLEATVYWLSCGIGVLLALTVCLISWPISILYRQPELVPVLCALSPILILSANLAVSNSRIVRSQRFDLFAAGDFGCAVLSAGVGIALAYTGFGIWSLVGQQLVLWATKAAWVTTVGRFRPRFVLKIALARPLFRFSANNLAANVADFAGKNAPLLIVGGMLGVGAAGHYSMAYQLTRFVDTAISSPVNLATFSAVAIAVNRQAASSFVLTALRVLMLVLTPLFCGLALTADPLAPLLLGPRWIATAPALAALSTGAFLLCLFGFANSALLGKGRSGEAFRLTLLTGVAMSLATFVGVHFGVTWAAAGFSFGTVALIPVYTWALARSVPVSIVKLLSATVTGLVSTAVMAAVIVVCRSQLVHTPPFVELVVLIATGVATYSATALVLGGSRIRSDLRKIRRKVPDEETVARESWRFSPASVPVETPPSA